MTGHLLLQLTAQNPVVEVCHESENAADNRSER